VPVSPTIIPKSVLTGMVQYVPRNTVKDLFAGFVPVYIDITSNVIARTLVTAITYFMRLPHNHIQ